MNTVTALIFFQLTISIFQKLVIDLSFTWQQQQSSTTISILYGELHGILPLIT